MAGYHWAAAGLLALCGAACATRPALRATPIQSVAEPPFTVGLWCSPPLPDFDDARAAEIAAAGFNVVGPPCEGPRDPRHTRRALDVAARHGLRLWVADDRLAGEGEGWRARVRAAVADYGGHPGFGDYFVEDEPPPERFAAVAAVLGEVRAADPSHLGYVNLLPDYAFADTASYRRYLDAALALLDPRPLSYDYYPFLAGGDRPTFFLNLGLVRQRAQARDAPFLLVIQAMPHGAYRDPTEAELGWQIFHALAYGARGVSYFAYWTPATGPHAARWQFRNGLMVAGRPTEHYFQATRVNRVAVALGAELAGYRSELVAESAPGEGALGGPVALEGGSITAGLFTRGTRRAVLVVNRDYRAATETRVRLSRGTALFEFAVEEKRWKRLDSTVLTLPPAGARLVGWQ